VLGEYFELIGNASASVEEAMGARGVARDATAELALKAAQSSSNNGGPGLCVLLGS
jgi:hypothetical protein